MKYYWIVSLVIAAGFWIAARECGRTEDHFGMMIFMFLCGYYSSFVGRELIKTIWGKD